MDHMTAGRTAPMPRDNVWEDDTIYREGSAQIDRYLSETVPGTDLLYREGPIPTAFLLEGRKNVTLDFNGAILTLHGRIQPFIFKNCENLTLKNVVIRYARSPFTEGTVVSAGQSCIRLKIPEAYPYRTEDGELIPFCDEWENRTLDSAPMFLQFFNGTTRSGTGIHLAIFGKEPKIDPSLPWAKSTIRFVAREEDGVLCLERTGGGAMPPAKPGDHAVIGHEERLISGIRMECCENVRLENVRIVNGFGMGIFPFHCKNILLDGLKMTFDPLSPGFVANAADGIHAFGCSGDFIIRNSVVEGTIDDALNIHSNFYTVKKASGCTIVAYTGLEPKEFTPLFLAGDRIRIHKGYTMEYSREYTITAIRPVGEKLVEMTLDGEADGACENDAIENMSTQCRIRISDCRFGKANSHLRFQSRGDILIENCETELPFLLTGDTTYWFESSPCEHFTVRNTRFTTSRAYIRIIPEFVPTPEAPYYHGDIRVENCTFVSEQPVTGNNARSVTLVGCRHVGDRKLTVSLKDCGQVVTE